MKNYRYVGDVSMGVSISPSWRDVSPVNSAGALDWFYPGSASRRRRSVPKDSFQFFLVKTHHIAEDGHRGPARGPMRWGARLGGRPHPPPSWLASGPPLVLSSPNIFDIFQNWLSWSFRTFGVVQNRSLIFAPFLVQNSSCRHFPSSCKPYKIRENRHKYCDIMCNNSP